MTTGFTLWLTGLSGAGKSTLAELVAAELRGRGAKVEVLDGDVVRTHLSKGLGFSKADRDTNVLRIGWVCALLARNDVVAIAAAISPYRAARDEVRASVGRFVEVFVDVPLEAAIARDTKGLYRKALAGEITGFTGVDDPYEPPLAPEVTVHTADEPPIASAGRIVDALEALGYLQPWPRPAIAQEPALQS